VQVVCSVYDPDFSLDYNASDLESAVVFYMEQLISRRLRKKLTIHVKATHVQDDLMNYQGACVPLDDVHRPKEFAIKLNASCKKEALLFLAHEMVHVKQYTKGELRDYIYHDDIIGWKGAKYPAYTSGPEYADLPWEVEAFCREEELYEKWRKFDES
jgi:hypothetical protein